METAPFFYICVLWSAWFMLGNPQAAAGVGEGQASCSHHPVIKTSQLPTLIKEVLTKCPLPWPGLPLTSVTGWASPLSVPLQVPKTVCGLQERVRKCFRRFLWVLKKTRGHLGRAGAEAQGTVAATRPSPGVGARPQPAGLVVLLPGEAMLYSPSSKDVRFAICLSLLRAMERWVAGARGHCAICVSRHVTRYWLVFACVCVLGYSVGHRREIPPRPDSPGLPFSLKTSAVRSQIRLQGQEGYAGTPGKSLSAVTMHSTNPALPEEHCTWSQFL